MDTTFSPGQRVRFLSNALGVIDPGTDGRQFTEHVVGNGDEGEIIRVTLPDGWLAVAPDKWPNFYVPVDPGMIEAVS